MMFGLNASVNVCAVVALLSGDAFGAAFRSTHKEFPSARVRDPRLQYYIAHESEQAHGMRVIWSCRTVNVHIMTVTVTSTYVQQVGTHGDRVNLIHHVRTSSTI